MPKKAAALALETATTSGEEHVASPPKVSKVKEISAKDQKAAPKLVAKKRVIPQKVSALPDEGAMASDDIIPPSPNSNLISVSGVPLTRKIEPVTLLDLDPDSDDLPVTGGPSEPPSPAGEISELIQQVNVGTDPDTDLDGEDYYIVEDDNESASFEYVLCVNYPNDKVYPEDEKNGWVRLEEDTGVPNIYIDLRDPVKTTWI